MKRTTLMLLRVSVGLLVLLWGIDKLVNVDHAVAVSNRFYFGAFSSAWLLSAWGAAQCIVGVLTVVGLWRRLAYPLLAAINGATLLVVWRSVLDPWGWILEDTNVLFFPSTTVFFASLLVWAFMEQDTLSLDFRSGKHTKRLPLAAPDTEVESAPLY